MDNTWSAGVYHKPLALGFDISVQANTKYVSGGADVINGAVLTNRDDMIARLKETIADLGINVAPDDAYLVLRGLRTLETRMARHQAGALEVARWLKQRPEVLRVLHPALEDDPGHALWKRDFSGASGLFGFVLKPVATKQVFAFLDALELFGLGFSYGGFESLAIYCNPQLKRTATKPFGGPLIRLSIGLEESADLIADIEQAFAVLG
jgi:cystathionine beta-lyase